MILDIYIERWDNSLSSQYSGFWKFRREIFWGWTEDLGKLYDQKFWYLWDRKLIRYICILWKFKWRKIIWRKIKKKLDEYGRSYNGGIKLFLYHSDYVGEFNPAKCELLLISFENVNPVNFMPLKIIKLLFFS